MEKYNAADACLYAVSPQLPENNRATIEKHGLNFEILHDQDNAFAKQLDLVHGFPQELKDIYQGTFGIDVGWRKRHRNLGTAYAIAICHQP